jgi:hypothetical protein
MIRLYYFVCLCSYGKISVKIVVLASSVEWCFDGVAEPLEGKRRVNTFQPPAGVN